MQYNINKIDEVVLALLFLNAFEDEYGVRAWKNLDWDAMDRLYERGLISDPKSKAKSVMLSAAGAATAEAMFIKYFGARDR